MCVTGEPEKPDVSEIQDIILLDNSPNSYIWQPQNALPISSWYGDYQDIEFAKLTGLFVKLSQVGDVREILSISHKEHQLNLKMACDMAD